MKKNAITIGMAVAAVTVMMVMSGCGADKESSAITLDEARLSISSARNAKAGVYAPEPLRAAEAALAKAESAFKGLHYSTAKADAKKAVSLAKQAQIEAATKSTAEKRKTGKKGVTSNKKTQKPAKNKKRA